MILRRTIIAAATLLLSMSVAAQPTSSTDNGTSAANAPRNSRQSVLMSAKNLVVTTQTGTVYYYLVSNDVYQTIILNGSKFEIAGDMFDKSAVKSMRFRSLPRFVLSEDSTTFDKTRVVDHGLVALRRSLQVGKWNSLVLPFDLTGAQVLDAFGEGTELATPRGIKTGDETVLEFSSIDLTAGNDGMKANYHYLIRPTREADLEEGRTISNFITGMKLEGPIYFIGGVSVKKNASPRIQTIKSEDESVQVRYRGTYLKLDNSVLSAIGRPVNKMIADGTYMLDDEGAMHLNEDSTAVRAFTSWIEDISSEPQELKFYIDGVNESLTAIADCQFSNPTSQQSTAVYDLSGRRVANDAAEFSRNRAGMKAGVYIVNGRKYIIK